jgi:exopolysaccharide biosynthesis WecB/TagA/CpsF family protein
MPWLARCKRQLHLQTAAVLECTSRAVDLFVATLLIGLLSPLLAIRAVAGRAATGRCLTVLRRIGKNGKEFESYYFAGDFPGRQLALLWNLLQGTLTLGGPRPLPAGEQQSQRVDPQRVVVRPGLVSPYAMRKRMNLAWESEAEIEREFVHSFSPMSGIGVGIRSLIGRLLGGQSERPMPRSISFFGIEIRNTVMDEALDWIVDRVHKDKRSLLAFVNPDCLNIAWNNSEYRKVLKNAERVLPDGIGIHLGCRIKGTRLADNLNGTDLFPRLCDRASHEGLSIFLLGARPGIAAETAHVMQKRYPALKFAGTMHGYFSDDENGEVIQKINDSGADILLVATGAPRQELWLARNAAALKPTLRMGVGGLFDFYSGRIRRATGWVRELGMEWVWRLLMEPRRLWRRYVIGNPLFLARVWREKRKLQVTNETARQRADITGRRIPYRRLASVLRRLSYRFTLATRQVVKRSLDVVGAALALLFLFPLLALIAVAIRLESPGAVLFRQTRVGLDGRHFTMWKFRSMYIDGEARLGKLAEQNEMEGGVLFKIKKDPRITRVGRFIRRTSIDELPQLWNVLIGDMSFVGPRPPLPSEVEQYALSDRQRLHVKPGITCIWQVSGRSDIPFKRQVELDIDYLYSQSIWTDLKLLLKTIPAVVLGKGAY